MTAPFVMRDNKGGKITKPTLSNYGEGHLGQLITMGMFRRWVRQALVNDGDGHGYLATHNQVSDVIVQVSDMEECNHLPKWATHVVWLRS